MESVTINLNLSMDERTELLRKAHMAGMTAAELLEAFARDLIIVDETNPLHEWHDAMVEDLQQTGNFLAYLEASGREDDFTASILEHSIAANEIQFAVISLVTPDFRWQDITEEVTDAKGNVRTRQKYHSEEEWISSAKPEMQRQTKIQIDAIAVMKEIYSAFCDWTDKEPPSYDECVAMAARWTEEMENFFT